MIPGLRGKGNFQLELNGQYTTDHEHEDGFYTKESGGNVTTALTYGIADNIDLVVGLPWQWSSLLEGGSIISNDKGIGDTSVEIKWKFFECELIIHEAQSKIENRKSKIAVSTILLEKASKLNLKQ